MAKHSKPRSLFEQIADFDDPAPLENDPEDAQSAFSNSGSGSEEDVGQAGRDHYQQLRYVHLVCFG